MRPTFDNQSLIDWLSVQDPAKSYDYMSCRECLIAQFLQCRGYVHASVDSEQAYLRRYMMGIRPLPLRWNSIAQRKPWTFGAALARAREALGK